MRAYYSWFAGDVEQRRKEEKQEQTD